MLLNSDVAAAGDPLSARPTRILAESVSHEEAARGASTIYGLTLLVTATLVSALWR